MKKKKSKVPELVTRDYLGQTLDIQFSEFEDRFGRRMGDAISSAMDKLYTRIDPILAEIENHRIDRDLTTEKLEDHEKRIKKLEGN